MENECVDFPFSIFSFALIAFGTFFVGRDKVNCGIAAREGALGYDLGAPVLTIGTRYPVGEHIVLPRNVKSNGSWTFLAQTPVALRAHTVRPYD